MALTPDDVVNKRFQTTKFRDGYDQDQVDDFLDEVVVELRRLNQENEKLKAELAAGGSAPAAPAAVVVEPVVEPAVVEPIAQTTSSVTVVETEDEENGSTSLLVLARRLHEEHVREGIEKRDALIAEGHATAARLVSEAEAKERSVLEDLEKKRAGLQKRVDELGAFEGEYRRKIKTHLEELISELNNTGASA